KKPSALFRQGNKYSRSQGTMTKMPQRPRMTLGRAASSSMKMINGCRSHGGAGAVRNTALAMLSGTARNSATREETSVPKMNGSAPNRSFTGSHSELVRKRAPNFWMARCEPRQSSIPIRTIKANTDRAISKVSHLKARSPSRRSASAFADKACDPTESELAVIRSTQNRGEEPEEPCAPRPSGQPTANGAAGAKSVLNCFDPLKHTLLHGFRQRRIVER